MTEEIFFIIRAFGGYFWGGTNLKWAGERRQAYGFISPDKAREFIKESLAKGETYFLKVNGLEVIPYQEPSP